MLKRRCLDRVSWYGVVEGWKVETRHETGERVNSCVLWLTATGGRKSWQSRAEQRGSAEGLDWSSPGPLLVEWIAAGE